MFDFFVIKIFETSAPIFSLSLLSLLSLLQLIRISSLTMEIHYKPLWIYIIHDKFYCGFCGYPIVCVQIDIITSSNAPLLLYILNGSCSTKSCKENNKKANRIMSLKEASSKWNVLTIMCFVFVVVMFISGLCEVRCDRDIPTDFFLATVFLLPVDHIQLFIHRYNNNSK